MVIMVVVTIVLVMSNSYFHHVFWVFGLVMSGSEHHGNPGIPKKADDQVLRGLPGAGVMKKPK